MKFKFGKDLLVLTILTLLVIVTWVGFDIYKALNKTTIPKATKEQMQKLDPTLNTKVIEDIKSRIVFSEDDLNNPSAQVKKDEDEEAEIENENEESATVSGQEQD
ncbi:MAG: hypothetical protein ABIH88_02010 [Patescibacteria group bacterium]